MTYTIANGVKRLVVDGGRVNQRAWIDAAPDGATLPYVTITDAISIATQLVGDGGDSRVFVRQVQVDLWESIDHEDDDLAQGLYQDLHRKIVPTSADDPERHPAVKTRTYVQDIQRLPEPDTRIAHRAFTLAVRHDPTGL